MNFRRWWGLNVLGGREGGREGGGGEIGKLKAQH